MQASLGNAALGSALGGEVSGFGGLVTAELIGASAGLGGQVDAISSNVAMLRAMRDAMYLGPVQQAALDGISTSGGQRLPAEQRERMERAFGHDFGHVRVHTDGRAAQAADALQAHAFALGADIFFGAGEWAPGTQKGDRLLAHELTHVVQHDERRLPAATGSEGDVQVSNPSEPSEVEAYQNEVRILHRLPLVDRELQAERRGDLPQGEQVLEEEEAVQQQPMAVQAPSAASPAAPVDVGVAIDPGPSFGLEAAAGLAPGLEGAAFDEVGFEAAPEAPAMLDRERHGDPRLPDHQVMSLIRGSRGQPLPPAVASKLAAVLGHDFSHVRVHVDDAAARAAEALNANAFALGADIFFDKGRYAPGTAEGDRLLAHELTHVVQHDEGRLPGRSGGLDVSSPSDSAEREAEAAAATAAPALQVAEVAPEMAAPTPEVAATTVLPTAGTIHRDAGDAAEDAPDRVELEVNGVTIEVRVPAGTEPGRVRVPIDRSPIEGLQLRAVDLVFDDEWNVRGGELQGSLEIGEYISVSDLRLRINDGARVEAEIRGADVTIGELVIGQIDLTIGTEGISGQGTFLHDAITIEPGFELTGGELEVALSAEGVVTGSGELRGQIEGLGGFTLHAELAEDAFTGGIDVELEEGLELADGIVLEGGSLDGSYGPEGTEIGGSVTLNVHGLARAEISATYRQESGAAEGSASETGESAEVQSDEGPEAQESVEAEAPEAQAPVEGSEQGEQSSEEGPQAGPEAGGGAGSVPLSSAGTWSISGTITQIDDVEVGGVTVSNAVLEVAAEDNVLTELSGSFDYSLPHFAGSVEGAYNPEARTVTGTGHAEVTESLEIDLGFGTFTLIEGGHIDAEVADGELTSLTGDLPFRTVIEGDHPLVLEGHVDGSYDHQERQVDGSITASLVEDLTLELDDGEELVFKAGSTATADIEDNAVSVLTVDLESELLLDGELFLKGSIEGGRYEVESGDTDFEGTLTLMQPVEERAEDDSFALIVLPESSVTATVVASELEKLGGNVNFQIEDEDGPLLDGALNDIELVLADETVSGELDVRTARDFEHPRTVEGELPPDWQLVVETGSGVQGRVEENELTDVMANLDFRLDEAGEELARGYVNGHLDLQEDVFSGQGGVSLSRDLALGDEVRDGERIEGWSFALAEGSRVDLFVEENAFEKATVSIEAKVFDSGEQVARATVNGDYALGDEEGFTGEVAAEVLEAIHWHEGERFDAFLDDNTKASVNLEADEIVNAEGDFGLSLFEDGVAKVSVVVAAQWSPGEGLDAEGEVAVLEDLLIYNDGDAYSLWLEEGSGGEASVESDELRRVSGGINLRLDEDATPIVGGTIQATYEVADGEQASIDGTGRAEVLNDIEIEDELFTFVVEEGSSVEATLADSSLESVEGNIDVRVEDEEGQFLQVGAEGRYEHAETSFSGLGSATVTRDVDLDLEYRGYHFFLVEGAGAIAEVEENELTTVTGLIPIRIDDEEGQLVQISLDGTYDVPGESFDGTGRAELLRQVKAGELGEEDIYEFFVEPGTEARATVEDNELTEVGGTLKASVHDEEGQFLFLQGEATWQRGEESTLCISGNLDVTREKLLYDDEFTISLVEGSGMEGEVVENELQHITGLVGLRIDEDNEPFVMVTLEGSYTPSEGVHGTGTATLLREIEVGEFGDFALFIEPGTEATATVVGQTVTELGGTLNLRLDDGGTPFIRGELTGTFDMEDETFTGRGEATVLSEKHLGTIGSENFYLNPGSGAHIGITDNDLTEVGGNLVLSMRDESEYLVVNLEGTYDITGGTGFTGSGEATVTREKMLVEVGDYQFWLAEGAGAEATVVENELTRVGGRVPFIIKDGEPEPLLRGHVEGEYLAETGVLNGTGSVYLGRDVEYELTSDTKVVFKEGSGGEGVVADSQLQSLSGTLTAELHVDEEPLVRVSANGEYNAVTNTIVELDGQATLLQPISLLDGEIIVSDVTGNARIENNRLVRAGGGGTITLPNLNNLSGTFDVQWRTEGGVDKYSGSGSIEFTLIDDAPRSMSGSVDAEYNEDDTFSIEGDVDYQINEMLGGEIGVKVDQDLDPELSGSMTVNGTLVEASDLFRMQADLIPHQEVNVYGPIALTFGAFGGLGLAMQALTFETTIGVEGWKPLSEDSSVPDFTADLDLNWGLTFEALLGAYMGLGLSVQVASASAGIRGEALLEAPLNINPYGRLEGGADGFTGELGVGISLAPTMLLRAIPYVEARLRGIDPFRHDFTGIEANLGELFRFEWGTSYTFGDREERTDRAPEEQSAGAAAPSEVEHTERPALPESSGASNQTPGGPSLESGSEIADQQALSEGEGAGEGPLDGLMDKIDKVEKLAKGIGALAELLGLLVSVLTVLSTFGPAGLIIYLIWKIFKRELSWSRIKEAVLEVVAALRVAGELIRPYLPSWMSRIIEFFQGRRPGLLDALFGGKTREMKRTVDRGDHREAPPDMLAEIMKQMAKRPCSRDDSRYFIRVAQSAQGRGLLGQVMSHYNSIGGRDPESALSRSSRREWRAMNGG